jgi:predicted phosphodiesterase
MTMRVGVIGDSHFGVRAGSQAFIEHFRKFYSEVFFPTLEFDGVDTIFHLGDLVDRRKYIEFVSLKAMREMFFDECLKRNIKVHLLV